MHNMIFNITRNIIHNIQHNLMYSLYTKQFSNNIAYIKYNSVSVLKQHKFC